MKLGDATTRYNLEIRQGEDETRRCDYEVQLRNEPFNIQFLTTCRKALGVSCQ